MTEDNNETVHSLQRFCDEQRARDDPHRRADTPLRHRLMDALIVGLHAISAEKPDDFLQLKLLDAARWRYMTEPYFHAIAESVFGSVMREINLGEGPPE